jgi:putative metallohydrolase (TIGR04338 family)
MTRDNDRAKVYAAESEVELFLSRPGTTLELHGSTIAVPDERKFGRVEDVQRYVNAALEHVGKEIFPVTVRARKGEKKAHYSRIKSEIAVPENAFGLRETTVLHELAHHLTPLGFVVAAHGPEFRSVMTELMGKCLGPEAQFLLRQAYGSRGLSS